LKFVALLRGINVGKSVQVPMKTLKVLLEELGLEKVVTYLNSGNAVFNSDLDSPEVSLLLESELERRFGQKIPVLVKSSPEIIRIQEAIPPEWKNDESEQTYVAYLFKDFARPDLISELPIKTEFMTIMYAHETLIWNIKRENYNKSQITKIASHKSYSGMTTRNVNTARKLADLCRAD
jgi:uncharacterized protein (DUF1697 family)